jgi:hypothetical protein
LTCALRTLRDKEEKMINNPIEPTVQSHEEAIPASQAQTVEPAGLFPLRIADLTKAAPSLAVLAVGFLANSSLPEFISSYGGRGH